MKGRFYFFVVRKMAEWIGLPHTPSILKIHFKDGWRFLCSFCTMSNASVPPAFSELDARTTAKQLVLDHPAAFGSLYCQWWNSL